MPLPLDRRAFLASGAAFGLGASSTARADDELQGDTYQEPSRKVPIVERADVVVCGAGPAGVAAAIAAAGSVLPQEVTWKNIAARLAAAAG